MKIKFLLGASILIALWTGSASADPINARSVLAADYSTGRMAIVDAQGKVAWQHAVRDIHDVHRLPGGNILFQDGWTRLVEITPEKKEIWSYDSAVNNGNQGKRVEVHAFQRLDNGHTMIAESGPGRIIEVDREGRIQKEIALQRDHPSAHSDTRLVRKLADGHYLAAQESDGKVREYDEEGRVIWEYAVPLFGKEPKGGHGLEAFGNSLYSALRLPNGNTLVGTGNGHSLLEVTPEKEIVWSLHQDELPGLRLAWVTMVAVLKNGNILIGNCHAGPENPQIIEITKDKKLVWSFQDFETFGNATPVFQILGAGTDGMIR